MAELISRRRVLAEATNIIGAGTLLSGLPLRAFAQAPKPITVGFIYAATRNDYGWNQAHAVAAKRIAQLPGVKLIEQEAFDIVITDLKMPRRTGFDLLAWIQDQPQLNCPPVVVLSGSAEDSDKEHALGLGAVGYFVKPPGLEQMVRLAHELKESWLAPLSHPTCSVSNRMQQPLA